MKLSNTALLILGIGIFVIVLASLVWVYLEQRGERAALDDSLSAAQATVTTLVSEEKDWESQLSQLESELAQATVLLSTAKLNFPHPVESIEVDEKLFMVADSWDLEVIGLTSSTPTKEVVENVTYSVTSFTVNIKGEVADILSFANTIATDEYFDNATVKLASANVPEPRIGGEEEEEKPLASFVLNIYSY